MVTRHSWRTVRPPAPESKMPMGRASTTPILRTRPGSVPFVLELSQADGAFTLIEDYLRDSGFFAGRLKGCVADLYLGYGLSTTLRRTTRPDPPEPAALPLAACRIRRYDEPARSGGEFSVGGWDRTWDSESYSAAIAAVRQAIAEGDVYQVNLVQHLSAPFSGDPSGLAPRLA